MAEVLSQQEIDLLLNQVKGGEETTAPETQEHQALPFDFRLPNRISKNQLRTIKNIFENFSESLSSFLLAKLQSMVSVTVTSVDQIYYSEYILSVSNPACLYTFDIRGTDIKGILELSPDFALCLVDRLLGGNGLGTKQSKIITAIEQKVLNVIVDRVMMDMRKAWQVVDNFDFTMERFEADIDFAQITSHSESVLLVSFEVLVGEQSFMMNICFATFAFDTILSKMTSKKLTTIRPGNYNGVKAQTIISNHLLKTYLPVRVEFGGAKISVDELMNLEEGDVIKLQTRIGDDLVVHIADKAWFSGRPGIVNKHKAIKIVQNILHNENHNKV